MYSIINNNMDYSFSGTISILREGCVPALKVRQIFERVKSNML